ncbi:DUF4157 domain-containing protein [Bacterioplanoides sp.]|uniref:eCIS core domain-containing protein n=1 Tax=Bacterioplanoides sp. TaxID=2066072 RepID=UPI003B5C247E
MAHAEKEGKALSKSGRSAAHSRAVSQRRLVSQRHAYLEDNRDHENHSDSVSQQVAQKQSRPNHTGLPDNLKSGMENLSGMSLDHVKVHYNSSKPAAVQAHAFAQGSDIHLASGQEKHLPHELGHVVQQMQGRVTANTSVNGMAVNDNPSLETEATVMGEKALRS